MWRGLLCACLGTAWVTSAHAGGAGDLRNDWSGEYAPKRSLSITVTPLSLIESMLGDERREGGLDFTAELRTGGSRSIAITKSVSMARRGPITWSDDTPGTTTTGNTTTGTGTTDTPVTGRGMRRLGAMELGEIGFQVRDYFVGSFDNGLFVGGQLKFTNPDLLRMRADETNFGPMGGVKVSLSIFTVEGRAGAWLGMGKDGLSIEPRVDFATGFTF